MEWRRVAFLRVRVYVGLNGGFGGFADQRRVFQSQVFHIQIQVEQVRVCVRIVLDPVQIDDFDVLGRVKGHFHFGHGVEHAADHQGCEQQGQQATGVIHLVFLLQYVGFTGSISWFALRCKDRRC